MERKMMNAGMTFDKWLERARMVAGTEPGRGELKELAHFFGITDRTIRNARAGGVTKKMCDALKRAESEGRDPALPALRGAAGRWAVGLPERRRGASYVSEIIVTHVEHPAMSYLMSVRRDGTEEERATWYTPNVSAGNRETVLEEAREIARERIYQDRMTSVDQEGRELLIKRAVRASRSAGGPRSREELEDLETSELAQIAAGTVTDGQMKDMEREMNDRVTELDEENKRAGGDIRSFQRGMEAGRCRALLEIAFTANIYDGADVAKMLLSKTWARLREARKGTARRGE